MSDYGNPPNDPYGQNPGQNPGQDPYAQGGQPAQNPYGEAPYGQDPYAQGQSPYGQQPGFGAPVAYSHWGKRVGSYLIDGLLTSVAQIPYIIGVIMAAGSVETQVDPVTGAITQTGSTSPVAVALMGIGIIFGIAFFIWNSCFKQGTTGYSIGKGILGMKLIKIETGQPIGAGMAFVRQIAHILDSICLLGYLWPLWDAKRQTFADKIIGTVVIDQPKG